MADFKLDSFMLKYSALEGDAPEILAKDEATCFAASEKVHALGCRTGSVHVLDFKGNKVGKEIAHDFGQRCDGEC